MEHQEKKLEKPVDYKGYRLSGPGNKHSGFGGWDCQKKISNELSIRGNGIAADFTGFEIPERGIFFDGGKPSRRIPKLMAVTHSHGDHISCIPKILTNYIKLDTKEKKKRGKVIILVPASRGKQNTALFIRNYINSYFQLEMCSASANVDKYIDIVEMRGGSVEISKKKLKKLKKAATTTGQEFDKKKLDKDPSVFEINISNTLYVFEAIDCYHSVPTASYLMAHKKKKLQEKYKDMSKEEIIELSKSGVIVDEVRKEPIFAFICDSSILVLEKNPHIFEYPIIMIECTFLDPKDIEQAKSKRHIHWLELEPYIKKYSNIMFMLFHFSSKHQPPFIASFFAEKHKKGMTNVDYFI